MNIIDFNWHCNVTESFKSIEKMKKRAAETPFVIINFPLTHIDPGFKSCGNLLNEELAEFTQSKNISFIDLCDYVNISEIRSNTPINNGHYNEYGNKIVAEMIYDLIVDYINESKLPTY